MRILTDLTPHYPDAETATPEPGSQRHVLWRLLICLFAIEAAAIGLFVWWVVA